MDRQTTCPHCGRSYSVDASWWGRQVQCSQCSQSFTVGASSPATGSAAPAAPAPAHPYSHIQPPTGPRVDNPLGGPTNRQFRLGAAVGLPIVVLGMLAALFAMRDLNLGAVFIVAFGPFGICFGLAALVDPDIVRAAGKFGGHLPARYRLIAGLIGLVALLGSLALAYVVWSRLTPS